MNNASDKILETLQVTPLSEEEKAAKHILKRLYGPIASYTTPTRNEHDYCEELWQKQLDDEIFQEKVQTKAMLLEFGHPKDREEISPEKVCACIPEMPKMIDGDLYAYIDVLDTPIGRILNTLIEYGFQPGISSRGSGELIGDNMVDPETFFLETWDIVPLPALKKARLKVCEGLDVNNLKMKKALTEAYNKESAKNKKLVDEVLDALNIKLDSKLNESLSGNELNELAAAADKLGISTMEELIAFKKENNITDDHVLLQTLKNKAAEQAKITDSTKEITEDMNKNLKNKNLFEDKKEADKEKEVDSVEETTELNDVDTAEITNTADVADAVDATADIDADVDKDSVDVETIELDDIDETDELTVLGLLADLEAADPASVIKVAPLEFEDGSVYNISLSIGEDEDGVLEFIPEATLVEGGAEEDEEAEEEAEDEDENDENNEKELAKLNDADEADENDTDTADDNGVDEILDSLKEAVRRNRETEKKVAELNEQLAVRNKEVSSLEKEVAQYKESFARMSIRASRGKKFETKCNSLTENLNKANENIKMLEQKVSEKDTELQEALNTSNNTALTEQYDKCAAKLKESVSLAKAYKAKFTAVVEHYISVRANMLGVKSTDITNRLNENYTLKDIDDVCDQLVENIVNNCKLPFANKGNVKLNINESLVSKKANNANNNVCGYDESDFDDLMHLAGLK